MSYVKARAGLGRILVALAFASGLGGMAAASTFVEGTYDVTVGGFQIGVGTFKADVEKSAYNANVSLKMTGLARLVTNSRGAASASGAITGARVLPTRYSISTSSGDFTQSVRMTLAAGTVRLLLVDPLPRPRPDVIPVTMNERRGVVDPVSALVMPVLGTGDLLSPANCTRTLPVFDGRQRYDIQLMYDRMEKVAPADGQAYSGYTGPLLVCRAAYHAIAGHRANVEQVKQMEENRDMEVWLAPVAGTRILVPWKIYVKGPAGEVVIEASQLTMGDSKQADAVRAAKPAARQAEQSELRQ